MKKNIYSVLPLCIVVLSGIFNAVFADPVTYTDYEVTNEAELHSAFYDTVSNTKRIDINSNINLLNDITSPTEFNFMPDTNLIINGYNRTLDGGGKWGIIPPETSTTTINDLTLNNFSAPVVPVNSITTFGGAIFAMTGTLNIYNSHFTNNISDGGGGISLGGAIANHNFGDPWAAGEFYIYNSTFENNKAGINNAGRGGAIWTGGEIVVINSTFTKNSANPSDSNSYGGAIANMSRLIVFNSTFGSDNVADANSSYNGGAISTDTLAFISNSTFKNNFATATGGAIYNGSGVGYGNIFTIADSTFINNHAAGAGAIYNAGTARIYDSSFIGNYAQSSGAIVNTNMMYIVASDKEVLFQNNAATASDEDGGCAGAIGNAGGSNLYLIANTSGMTFTGNTAPKGSAIYNIGNLHLNAGICDITFNDSVYSDTGSTIKINESFMEALHYGGGNSAAPTTGRIVLNNTLTGGGAVNLNDGMLKVGTAGSIGASGAGNSIGALNFGNGTASSTILNLANGSTGNVYATDMTVSANNTTSVWMDIDATGTAYKLNTANAPTITGTLNLNTFRVLNDFGGDIAVDVANFDLTDPNIIVGTKTYTNEVIYTVSKSTIMDSEASRGYLEFVSDVTTNGLAAATADNTHTRSFSLVGTDYTLSSDPANIAGGTLTVFGTGKNGLAISGGDDTVDATGNCSLFDVYSGATLNIVDVILKNAYSDWTQGAAIFNFEGHLNVYDSLITNNKSGSYGGAIFNQDTVYINGSTFTKNTAVQGGAIYNSGSLSVYNSTFGGDDSSLANTAAEMGGAIGNQLGTVYISNSIFKNNTADAGGAISNIDGALNVYNSVFTRNVANVMGGAIHHYNNIANIYNSTFDNNSTTDGSTSYGGGAICNYTGTLNIYNSNFSNNHVSGNGGAIYNLGGTTNLIATSGDITFTGNTAAGAPNDIYLTPEGMNHPTLNLNATYGSKITFNGGIKSSAIADGTININKTGSANAGDPPTDSPTVGEIVLGAPIETSTVNLYNGTLTLNNDSYLNGNALRLVGGALNMQNGAAGAMTLSSLAVTGTTDLKIDANLATGTSDSINGTYSASTAKLNVSSIRLLNDSTTSSTTTQLLGTGLAGHDLITMGVTKAYTPIYQYNITYDDATGKLAFAGGGGGGGGGGGSSNFNPAVLNSPVSANVGAYMSQVSTYNEALTRAELFMSLPQRERLLMKQRNMYANVGGSDVQPEVFSPTFLPDAKGGIWMKQYTSFENVPLNNGPNVSNIGYGVLIGADSPMYQLKHGFDGYVTAYASYNGSHQNYDQVGVNQNGGALGVTGTAYKGNFFTALTASVGDSYGQANTMYGVDNFNTLLAGVAVKTGYNIEMAKGKVILQPSMMAAYTFANTFDYQTASGVNITSDPMNAIQLAPGVKLIANLKNGWQPYLATNMVFNIMDNQKFRANDVQLPQMSIAPYIEYGVGVQRRWGERFSGFGQAMFRGGGRNGVAFQFGFRIAIGK